MSKSQMRRLKGQLTDTDRLDWFERWGFGAALLGDDNGHWTVSFDGIQNVATGDTPIDISTAFFVEKGKWQNSVREAIDAAIAETKLEDTDE